MSPDIYYDGELMSLKEFNRRGNPLKSATNLRGVIPRVCATCASCSVEDGAFACARPGGYACDVGDMCHWTHVCDRWRQGDIIP